MTITRNMNDVVTLQKRNGKVVENIKASVQSNLILIMRSDILIEVGDVIKRKMSNGGCENFEILDPGFHEAHGLSFPAHYQIKVEKLGVGSSNATVQVNNYNVSGTNTRINIGSVDNSVNTVTSINYSQVINKMREELNRLNLSQAENKSASEIIDAVEVQCRSGQPSKSVLTALLAGLPQVVSLVECGQKLIEIFS